MNREIDRLISVMSVVAAAIFAIIVEILTDSWQYGIVAGGLLAFTLSIDDVVITSFVNGAGTNTFPTYVSSMTKHSRNLPSVFALSTLMLIFTCVLVGASKLITSRSHATAKKG